MYVISNNKIYMIIVLKTHLQELVTKLMLVPHLVSTTNVVL